MPLVPLEPCLYPESLFDLPAPPSEARWWLLHAKPRTEKALARQLFGRSVGFFLPLHERRHASGGRVRSSYLPLFPGYLFLFSDHEGRRAAVETNLVAHAMPVADQTRLHVELAHVRQLLDAAQELTPEERLAPGTPVRVIAGPLTGLTGVVVRRGRRLRFVVAVHLLGQGVSAEIDDWMIEPLA